MEQYERIKEMSEHYNVSLAQLDEMKAQLHLLKASKNSYNTLLDYYDQDWMADYDASNLPNFPAEANHAILSEDSIYNLIGDYRSLAIEMIEVGLSYLK
ncbi:DUF4298 domain-containing protein [Streptococcus merionis]|uniref:DUF4298 domain-containing protein n=1 Tax=Streptococcus merionis TaxID=400065 RepID=UPI003512E38D